MSTFVVPPSTLKYNPEEEYEVFFKDLRDVFPKFEEYGGELLLARNYCAGWPVTRSWQGYMITPKTPIENLYNVGDGVNPTGWMVGCGAAESARIVAEDIKSRIKS